MKILSFQLIVYAFLIFGVLIYSQDENVKEVTIYPNPTNGIVNIRWFLPFEYGRIDIYTELEVYTTDGQLIMKRPIYIPGGHGTAQIYDIFYLNEYSSGIYLIKLTAYGYLLVSRLSLIK